jgi:prepilin-type N-terminal cleavage/methylation domain-containing protein
MTKINKGYIRLLLLALKSKPSGYTLLESLMALVVVGILITSVAPMLALTTASRVQSRRVDQATQALRSYVDGVRAGVIPLPQKFVVLLPETNFKAPFYGSRPNATMAVPATADPGTLIDTNGNGFSVNDPQDLVIQAIRPVAFCPPIPPATANVDCVKGSVDEIAQARNQGFIMVVRVYRADAFANGALPDEAPTGTDQSNVFIGTLGSRNNPLVSSISEIFPEADSESIKGRNNLLIGGT